MADSYSSADDDLTYYSSTNSILEAERVLKKSCADFNAKYKIPDEYFDTPEMGDFYLGAVDDMYLRKIDAILKGESDDIDGAKPLDGDGKSAAFYTDAPKITKSDGKGHYFFKAKTNTRSFEGGWTNGACMRIPISSLTAEKGDEAALGKFIDKITNTTTPFGEVVTENDYISVTMYGINAPYPNRYAYEKNVPVGSVEFIKEDAKEAANNSAYTCEGTYSDGEQFTFVHLGIRYYQVEDIKYSASKDTVSFKWMVCPRNYDTQYAQAAMARVAALLNKQDDGYIWLVIDDNAGTTKTDTNFQYITDDPDACKTLETWAGNNKKDATNGYCLAKEDFAARLTGSIYCKMDGKWINIAKAVVADTTNNYAQPDNSFVGDDESVFVPNYDMSKTFYSDAYIKTWEELDDRDEIQRKIIGKDWDEIRKWTVTIGDVTLVVPPTNITVTRSTFNNAVPLLRARGTMPKGGTYTARDIQMTIYFSGKNGINGYDYTEMAPNGETTMIYGIDGLRALVSEFKFTPFLPIDNDYLNDVHGVMAVAFNSLQVQTIPGMPQLWVANLYLKEFNYVGYIPEVAMLGENLEVKNPFSIAFNWKTMRYYYQRALINGNTLRNSGYDINSKEYLAAQLKCRTALQPMLFKDSSMKFFLADPEYLEKMIEAKEERDKEKQYAIKYGDDEKEALNKIANISQVIKDTMASDEFKAANNELKNIRLQAGTDDNLGNYTVHYDVLPAFFGVYAVDSDGNLDKNVYGENNENQYVLSEKLNKICTIIADKIKLQDNVRQVKLYVTKNQNEKRILFGVAVKFSNLDSDSEYRINKGLSSITTDSTLQKLRKNMATFVGVSSSQLAASNAVWYFKDGWLTLPFVAYEDYTKNNDWGVKIDSTVPDAKVWDYALDKVSIAKNTDTSDSSTDDDGWTKASSMAQLDSMKFIELDAGTFWVTNISCSMSNTFSNVHVEETGKTSAQFLGGQDTAFDVNITTTDEKAVSMIQAIPETAALMMRRYRKIIPCYPIKVDCEFTRFFGVTEVIIEDIQVSTVPGEPGLYNIHFAMRSMDRTLREREAMEMYSVNNSGIKDSASTEAKTLKSYFDVEDTLAHAELYPDLELPTLTEMSMLGYSFVRYKFQDSRAYVDPDFYFVYMTRLSSQILRETIINSVKNGLDGSHKVTDMSGAQFSISPQISKGYSIIANNNMATNQINAMKKYNEALNEQNSKTLAENLKETNLALGSAVEDYDCWEICNDIRAVFMEKRYKKEADSYDARKKTEQAKKENSQKNSDDSNSDNSDTSDTNDSSSSSSDSSSEKMTEGAWVIAQLKNAVSASEKITTYLKEKPIDVTVPATSSIREKYTSIKKSNSTTNSVYSSLKTEIENGVTAFFKDSSVLEIMELLNIDATDSSFLKVTKDVIFAAACAATGEKEYSSKKKSTNWMPRPDYLGMKAATGSQNHDNNTEATSYEEAALEAVEFGAFNIKAYTASDFTAMTGETADDVWSSEDRTTYPFIAGRYLLDRYYRLLTPKEIISYKVGCINSPKYCTVAYLRNALYWLGKLIDKRALPSINADILRKMTKVEGKIKDAEENNNVLSSTKDTDLRSHLNFFSKNSYTLDAGKIWTCAMLASSDGSKALMRRIDKRDYAGLNEYLHGVSVPTSNITTDDKLSLTMRKADLALVGLGRLENNNATGVDQSQDAMKFLRKKQNELYIEAAEDPSKFMVQSCHDMIVHDARGRMLRAFPTYYMLMIDEGREVGNYKLHDNFYSSSNILEFTVVKDRKNPADTANITLTNIYQAYDTEGDTRIRQAESSTWDAFRTIFSPTSLAKDTLEKQRDSTALMDQIRLRAGARIHLRAGYGSNAVMLPIIFNGCIAEINAESTIEIVAQGDGIELMNPILEEIEAHKSDQKGHWLTNGETPKNIINRMLTTEGGWLAGIGKTVGRPDILGDNPYGIYHFGDKDFTSIVPDGEPIQNIFEAQSTPAWGGTGALSDFRNDRNMNGDTGNFFGCDKAAHITFDLFGKTPWDVINICRSVMPDFIAAVAPFDFRSTIFVGAPRYYYAYSYQNVNGAIHEKRKPFQQFHIYTSATDIVGNGVIATSDKIKTTATGLYQVAATGNIKEQHKVGPLYADIDIYPENQKSMIVDTQLFAKGTPILGAMGLNFFTSFETIDWLLHNEEESSLTGEARLSDKAIAWKMTASALKDSMKEMYAGDIVMLGDPTIKPHDRVYLSDNYNGITGQCTVKEVVHHMSLENGFITTFSPDCINTVSDTYERTVHNWFGCSGGYVATHFVAMANTARMYCTKATVMGDVSKIANFLKPKKAIETIAEAAKGSGSIAKAASTVTEAGSAVKSLAKKAGGRIVGGFAARLLRNSAVGAAGGPVGLTAALAEAAIETVAIELIGSWITSKFKAAARDLQVLTIYPLKRYGLMWVAGVAGSKGMIYGDPSYKENGSFTSMMNWFASVDDPEDDGSDSDLTTSSYSINDPSNAIAAFAAASMEDDEIYSGAQNKAKHRSGTIDESGNPIATMASFNNNLKSGQKEDKNAKNPASQDYRAMLISNRADFSLGNDAKQSYDHYALTDVNTYENDYKLRYNSLISEDNRIRPYIDEGFFKIIHETPALNNGAFVDSKIMNIHGTQKYVKSMKYKLDNGATVYDLPLLNKDAINILYEIIRRAKNHMPTANSSDPYESYNETSNSYIVLESALRVGDTESLAAAGFTFILQGVNNAVDPLSAAIKELKSEIDTSYTNSGGITAKSLFDSQVDSSDSTKIAIVVSMPRVSGTAVESTPVSE